MDLEINRVCGGRILMTYLDNSVVSKPSPQKNFFSSLKFRVNLKIISTDQRELNFKTSQKYECQNYTPK